MEVPTPATRTCDVLVIGSGAAGLRAAIAAADAGSDVLVVGRRPLRDAHTALAAGGINAVLRSVDPEDTWEQHFADTVAEAYLLADPRAVELLAREAPAAIDELAAWGCAFNRTEDGAIDQRYFGAHTYRRTCYVSDATGRAVLDAVADRAEQRAIPVLEGLAVTRLLVDDGACVGAYGLDCASGETLVVLAHAVVLAAGGHTRLWRRSSSRTGENTGDGIALGLQAGCGIADAELVQFHPTGMVTPEAYAGTLVTEAVRGEGGQLRNASGERFMGGYDAERMELSTRDIVARAIFTEIAEGRGTEHEAVWLDVSHLDAAVLDDKLARMRRQFLDAQGVDIAEEAVEVAPVAHYSMGGLVVDPPTHATQLAGLFAAGECTAGLHGANRLGGNSLSETLVFGRRAGAAAARHAAGGRVHARGVEAVRAAGAALADAVGDSATAPAAIVGAVRDVMWRDCGVVRDADGLGRALAELATLADAAAAARARPEQAGWGGVAAVLDARTAVLAAEATVRAAAERRESRGAHCRSDHPGTDEALRVNLVVRRDGDGLTLERRPVPPIPAELAALVERTGDLDVAGRLLE
jgi:succinate dehydrogenase / fumarate reductase, flavoprotein subunit